jgi:hypothetical protein
MTINCRFIYPLLFILLPAKSNAQQAVLHDKGKIILQPFAYGHVKLNDGPLKRQLDEVKDYYLRIPNDDLLKGFRQRMGFPTFGAQDMGGWYSKNVFHVFGQILSGLSRLYAVTGDTACRDKVNALVDGWGKCIDSSGFSSYSKDAVFPHYVYEKMVGGLVDAYLFTGNKTALIYLSRITDWSIKNLNKERTLNSVEWYTLSENLYRAYLVTHDKKYFDFANYWEYTSYWDALKNKSNIFKKSVLQNAHAYSHLNALSSAAMAYMVKGDEKYKTTIKNGYDFFVNSQCFATGGFGLDETLFANKTEMIQTFENTHKSFETQCGSWAGFKLCKYLLMVTGDGRYGDWVEKLVINGIGSDVPMSADGNVLYYSDYNPRGGTKQNNGADPWTCCTGTRPEAIAEYADLIYFKGKNGIYVNLYTPAKVSWNGISLSQTTDFPESDQTRFTINVSGNANLNFTLSFRKPTWLNKQALFLLNGKPITFALNKNWYQISRRWKNGDQLTMVLPMSFAISRLNAAKPYPAALTYGPVVMAMRSADAAFYPSHIFETTSPWADFTPVEGQALNYHVSNVPGLLIRPYYQFKANEPYITYVDPGVRYRVAEQKIITAGNWHGQYHYTQEAGASISTTFTGSKIFFKGYKGDDAGMCKITIDDKLVGTIDEYAPKPVEVVDHYGPMKGILFEKEFTGLSAGDHTIIVTTLSGKNEASAGNSVNYICFETPD